MQTHEHFQRPRNYKSGSVSVIRQTVKKIGGSHDSDVDSLFSDDDMSSGQPDVRLLSHKKYEIMSSDGELTWPGKDYVNWILMDVAYLDNADRLTTPRMPHYLNAL